MSETSYEAYCPHCEITHPPGTKRCLHCGGRVLGARPGDAATRIRRDVTLSDTQPDLTHDGSPFEVEDAEPGVFDESESVEDQAPRKGSGPLRFGISMLWIVIFVAASIYRSCVPGE